MDIDIQDRIDDYVFDRMSDDDRAIFEQLIRQDVAKQKQLELTKDVKRAICNYQFMNDELDKMYTKYNERHCMRKWWCSISVAAVLVAGIITILPTNNVSLTPDQGSSDEIIPRGDDMLFDSNRGYDLPSYADTTGSSIPNRVDSINNDSN